MTYTHMHAHICMIYLAVALLAGSEPPRPARRRLSVAHYESSLPLPSSRSRRLDTLLLVLCFGLTTARQH
jgi:hypothetical protein